jgi:hypothetical protein
MNIKIISHENRQQINNFIMSNLLSNIGGYYG